MLCEAICVEVWDNKTRLAQSIKIVINKNAYSGVAQQTGLIGTEENWSTGLLWLQCSTVQCITWAGQNRQGRPAGQGRTRLAAVVDRAGQDRA